MRISKNLPSSVQRSGWMQYDLHAYQHLLCPSRRKGEPIIKHGYFVHTKGFSTMQDLKYFENGGYENGN